MKFMLTCKHASQLISRSLDRPLSWPERIKLKFHLLICDACNRFNDQLNQLRIAVRRMRNASENDSAIQLPLEAKMSIAKKVAQRIESQKS